MTGRFRTTSIITPAATGALTTLAALKDEVQETGTGNDAYLMRRILAASSAISAYTGRTFGRETVCDTFTPSVRYYDTAAHRRHARPLEMSRDLIASVAGVSDAAGVQLDLGTYYVDQAAGLLYRLTMGRFAAWGWSAVSITYTTGWNLPGDPARDLPQIVEDVCIETAANDFYSRGRDPGLRNEAAEGVGSVRYTDAPYAPDVRLDPFIVRPR